jgi:Ca-activated chloride channel family protein
MRTSNQLLNGVALSGAILFSAFACNNEGQTGVYYEEMVTAEAAAVEGEYASSEEYGHYQENHFNNPLTNPLSTFSVDVDNASYANVRRFIQNNQLPPADAIRIEEMINYFNYDYLAPSEEPISIETELSSCPWDNEHHLLRVGLQSKKVSSDVIQKGSNLVFLLDVSGSMGDANKLPLLKKSIKVLLRNLSEKDRVSIVVYAGASGVVLEPTPGTEADRILSALDDLEAGGSTAGAEGIERAYELAESNFIRGGNNRIILATDGDFNVGVSSANDLVQLIEKKRDQQIYLTICGFGPDRYREGNYKDYQMEELSNAGNGNYFYIDNLLEANKVFNQDLTANMFTVADDVKLQIEFNPIQVKSYRLIGYENRVLATEDFEDDTKDAGDMGSGQQVTALYELELGLATEKELKYQDFEKPNHEKSDELCTVEFRYKNPGETTSRLQEHVVSNKSVEFEESIRNQQLATYVSGFGLLLKNSAYKGSLTWKTLDHLMSEWKGTDDFESEFNRLRKQAELLSL